MALEIVLIVFQQFEIASSGDAQEFQLRLCRRLSVATSLRNILFGAPGSLHHLIYRPVAIFRQIAVTEQLGKLIKHVALLIEPEFSKHYGFPQHTGCAVLIMIHWDWLLVFHTCI